MNQQVAVYDPRAQQIAPVPSFTMSDMELIALAIAKGGLFGSNDPNAVLTLCMVAQAEGKHPAQVMQDYDIIKGKPAKKAQAMLRDFISSGGKVVWNKLDDECADATFSHPQGGSVTINWTMARAQKAQLANGDNWKKYPRSMLRSRVVSEGVRTVYPGATSGMYVPEEVQDFDEPVRQPTPVTPEPKRARDLKREEPKAKALPEPQHDPETGEVHEEPAPTQTARQKAETWTETYIANVKSCADTDALIELQTKSKKTLDRLESEHADLHELTVNAGRSRAAELQGEAETFDA